MARKAMIEKSKRKPKFEVRQHNRCQRCGRTFEPIRPVLFSFNHPLGACPHCKGFGRPTSGLAKPLQ